MTRKIGCNVSKNEAKQELFKQVEQTATEMTAYIKDQEEEARSKSKVCFS